RYVGNVPLVRSDPTGLRCNPGRCFEGTSPFSWKAVGCALICLSLIETGPEAVWACFEACHATTEIYEALRCSLEELSGCEFPHFPSPKPPERPSSPPPSTPDWCVQHPELCMCFVHPEQMMCTPGQPTGPIDPNSKIGPVGSGARSFTLR